MIYRRTVVLGEKASNPRRPTTTKRAKNFVLAPVLAKSAGRNVGGKKVGTTQSSPTPRMESAC